MFNNVRIYLSQKQAEFTMYIHIDSHGDKISFRLSDCPTSENKL